MRGSMAAGLGMSVAMSAFATLNLFGLACPPAAIGCLGVFWMVATKVQAELDRLEEPDPEVTANIKKLIYIEYFYRVHRNIR